MSDQCFRQQNYVFRVVDYLIYGCATFVLLFSDKLTDESDWMPYVVISLNSV